MSERIIIGESDDIVSEKEALKSGLAILKFYKPTGDSDFDKGMRLLREHLGIKPKRRKKS